MCKDNLPVVWAINLAIIDTLLIAVPNEWLEIMNVVDWIFAGTYLYANHITTIARI